MTSSPLINISFGRLPSCAHAQPRQTRQTNVEREIFNSNKIHQMHCGKILQDSFRACKVMILFNAQFSLSHKREAGSWRFNQLGLSPFVCQSPVARSVVLQ